MRGGVLIYRFGPDGWAISKADTEPGMIASVPTAEFEVSPYTGTLVWGFWGSQINVHFENGEQRQFAADPDWGPFRQWLTNDRIILDVANPVRYQVDEPFPAIESIYILDMMTGQAVSQTIALGDQFTMYLVGALHDWRPVPVYDPNTATKAIYARRQTSGLEWLTMWDLSADKELWSKYWGQEIRYAHFAWDYTGQRAAIVSSIEGETIRDGRLELLLVSIDGSSVRLTHLAETNLPQHYSIISPTWSPDGSRIAFILSNAISFVDAGYTSTVVVVEVATGLVTDYCTRPVQWLRGLVWSPDSTQLAFIVEKNQLTVLDVEQAELQLVYQIPTNNTAAVKGWVAELP